jgi:hypothetical protein
LGENPGNSFGRRSEFPIVIAEWGRNAGEVIRVALDRYTARNTINVRVWYRDGEEIKRRKSRTLLSFKHLPPLADALARTPDTARVLGLLDQRSEP